MYLGMSISMSISRVLSVLVRLVLIVPLLGLLYIAAICVYRIFFHPYAKYPGPLLAKVSNAYAGYHSWKGDLHVDIWRCHQKYGNRVRYAPGRLLFNTPQAIKDIYSSGEKNVTKSMAYQAATHRVPNTMTLRDRSEHARRRRILGAGFSDSAIKSYESKIRVITKRFCTALSPTAEEKTKDGWSRSKNIADWSNYVFFDLANDLIFGQDWNSIENPEKRMIVTAIQESNVRSGVLSNMSEIKWQRLDKKLFIPSIIGRGHFIMFIRQTVQTKMTSKEREGDIFSRLAFTKDEETGSSLNEEELAAETANLIAAGSDTSSTTLAALFFYLSRYPDCYEKAFKEVSTVFKSPEDVTIGPALNSCTYLRACLDEALRMAPAVASSPWREVLAVGAVIDGCQVPPGLDVGIGIYSIQHNEKYVSDPFSFIPERWLPSTTPTFHMRQSYYRARSVFTPFSTGPRSCIGKSLAIAELMFIMASVVIQLDFRKVEGEKGRLGEGSKDKGYGRHRKEEYQLVDHMISTKDGPVLKFRHRNC